MWTMFYRPASVFSPTTCYKIGKDFWIVFGVISIYFGLSCAFTTNWTNLPLLFPRKQQHLQEEPDAVQRNKNLLDPIRFRTDRQMAASVRRSEGHSARSSTGHNNAWVFFYEFPSRGSSGKCQAENLTNQSPVTNLPVPLRLSTPPGTKPTCDLVVTDSSCDPELLKKVNALRVPVVSIEYIIQCLIHGKRLNVDSHPSFSHNYVSS